MQTSTFIHKSLSLLIVAIILHTYWCSVSCSIGVFSCCSTEKEHYEGEAANHQDADGCGNCQGEHLAFFKTVGQYPTLHPNAVAVFQFIVAEFLPGEEMQPIDVYHTAEIYTGFHPPPPKADTRILISSFQI